MSRLAGQLSFLAGISGLLFTILAFVLDWQRANGGVSMGLWKICAVNCRSREYPPVGPDSARRVSCRAMCCTAVTQNGMTAKQWGVVWITRGIVIGQIVACIFGLRGCAAVMQQTGTRNTIRWGLLFFVITGECGTAIPQFYCGLQSFPPHPAQPICLTAFACPASFVAVLSLLSVIGYMVYLKLPDGGQRWSAGVALQVSTIGIWCPLAFTLLYCALGAKRYQNPDDEVKSEVIRQIHPSSMCSCGMALG